MTIDDMHLKGLLNATHVNQLQALRIVSASGLWARIKSDPRERKYLKLLLDLSEHEMKRLEAYCEEHCPAPVKHDVAFGAIFSSAESDFSFTRVSDANGIIYIRDSQGITEVTHGPPDEVHTIYNRIVDHFNRGR